MATIEERATQDANERVGTTLDKFGHWLSHRDAYIRVATEQDRITRQNEQERCIKAAQDAHCAICGDIDCILVDKSNNERRIKCNQLRCIRKAIEEGGNL